MNQAEKYLNELMYHISTSHLDMGGKHHYHLQSSGWRIVSEIKVWLSAQQAVEDGQAKRCGKCSQELFGGADKCPYCLHINPPAT